MSTNTNPNSKLSNFVICYHNKIIYYLPTKMNKNHRYFIQFMLKNGVSSFERAREYCKHISDGDISDEDQFKQLISEINGAISQQNFKIMCSTCQVTNENIVAWLNTKNDDISKLQISYTTMEKEYFHTILQEILNSVDRFISLSVSTNISSTLTGPLARDAAEKALRKWIKSGYFVNKNDNIYLGPRLVLEFTSYLKNFCPDSVCSLCSDLVFYGQQCPQCDGIVHSHCLVKYLKKQKDCPSCHRLWVQRTNVS